MPLEHEGAAGKIPIRMQITETIFESANLIHKSELSAYVHSSCLQHTRKMFVFNAPK